MRLLLIVAVCILSLSASSLKEACNVPSSVTFYVLLQNRMVLLLSGYVYVNY